MPSEVIPSVRLVVPFVKLFTISLQEGGERHLLYATFARYPAAESRDPPGSTATLALTCGHCRNQEWQIEDWRKC